MQKKLWTDLSDEQAQSVVGGVGVVQEGGSVFGAGFYGWIGGANHLNPEDHKGLITAGFTPGTYMDAGPNSISLPGTKA